jgi:prepilin-type N-terminal cleavage/methylation domain-containing protein
MKRANLNISSRNGFTLIEIIATIVMMGILAAFFIHFMGTAMDDSWQSVVFVAGEAEAEGLLEEIIAYYTSEINKDPAITADPLGTLKTKIDGGYFGSSNMSWKNIMFDGSGDEQDDTTAPYYNLKVTVEAPGNDLTVVLTKSRVNTSDPVVYY